MAETWLSIDSAGLRATMADAEWNVFAAEALVPGGSDPVEQSIRVIVAEVQGAVAASGQNSVGPAGMVPPELERATYALLLEELASRIPNSGITFDKIREKRLADAKDFLKRVEEGKYRTTAPETIGTTATAPDEGEYGGEDLIDFTNLR